MAAPPRLARPHLEAVSPYSPGKPVEELERELGIAEAVKLASNENPLGPSPKAIAAIHEAAASVHRYPDNNAHALRVKLAARYNVAPNDIAFGHGANELIDLVARAFIGRGEHAVIGTPSFSCYKLALMVAEAEVTEVPLDAGAFWNVDRLLEAVQPNTKLLFLDNPNNPTSTYVARASLERLLASLPERVIPVIDEAYADFADAADYASALELRALSPNLIVLRTFSKAHGLAAVRAGYAIGPSALLSYLARAGIPFNLSSLAQAAAIAALDDDEHVALTVGHNRKERARLTARLSELGLRVAPSQTNFLFVELSADAGATYEALLHRGVIVRPLAGLPHHLRISIGLVTENDRLLAALREVLG